MDTQRFDVCFFEVITKLTKFGTTKINNINKKIFIQIEFN